MLIAGLHHLTCRSEAITCLTTGWGVDTERTRHGEGRLRARRVGVPTPTSDLACLRFLWARLHPGSQERASRSYLYILMIHCTESFSLSQDHDPRDAPGAAVQFFLVLQRNGPLFQKPSAMSPDLPVYEGTVLHSDLQNQVPQILFLLHLRSELWFH